MRAIASRLSALEVVWAGIAIACLAAMIVWPTWEAVPFHVIWITLALVYAYRVWSTGRRRAQMLATVQALADERASLLEHDERLLHDVSHELRTPVTIARGHLELLQRRLGEKSPELSIAFEELARMELLIDRILLLARAERSNTLQRERVALVPFLEDVLVRWAGTAPRAWRLGSVVDVDLDADPTWLHAAVDALVENAVQHTDEYERIDIAAHADANEVVITVRDHGPGVPPELLDRIFERFARSDTSRSRREGGAGLGLSIVSAIAHAHGGSCQARNAAGGGMLFELRFPLARASAAEHEAEAGPPRLIEPAAALQP